MMCFESPISLVKVIIFAYLLISYIGLHGQTMVSENCQQNIWTRFESQIKTRKLFDWAKT
jgi:hypothetical protein